MKTRHILLFSALLIFGSCTENTTETTEQQTVQQETNQEQQSQEILPLVVTIDDNIINQNMLEGYQLVAFEAEKNLVTGDFNGDNQEDFAIVIASDNVEIYQDAEDVRIAIFEGNDDGTFKLAAKSGNVTGYFIHNAETNQLSLTKNVISLTHQGMRFDRELKYRYNAKVKDYVIIGSENNSYGNAVNDGSGNVSTNYLGGVRLENLNEWNQKTEKLIELPEVKTKVSTTPQPLSELNEDSFWNY